LLRLHKECPSQLSLPMPPGIPPSTPFEHNYADCVGQQCLVIDCPDRVKYSKPLKVRRKQNRTVSLAASGTTSLDWVPDKLSSDGGQIHLHVGNRFYIQNQPGPHHRLDWAPVSATVVTSALE